MVPEDYSNLKQLWKGLRHLYRALAFFRRFSIEFRGSGTFKTVLVACGNLKQFWES